MNDSLILNNNSDDILHVIYDYTSKEDDELTLKRGSILEVLSKDERISGSEGWWTGRLLDSESVGIFPANFVANLEPQLRVIDYKDLQIGDLIGVGGFGHVHYGKFGDVDVAIKTAKSLSSFSTLQTPTSSKSSDDDTSNAVHKNLIDGLLREARLFSNLKHRNIIKLFGVSPSLSTRNVYLVMEYAHGGALNHLLERRKSGLYPNVFIQYAKQIVDGMKYLHDEAPEHIIHRDLKCSNILIVEPIDDVNNDNELLQKTLKITDFGLAKKQLQLSSVSAAGTFAWMSPECIRNNEYSTKSDVWSFGVLLWECLTGEIPYKGFDQMQVAFGIATNKYSLPIPSTCPEEFSQLIKDCWHILPQDRPTFNQLCEQIDNIIEKNYGNNELNKIESIEESYSSLQKDWRKEIQDIFEELKTKEQEIRDREQAMLQLTIQQNHQRIQLEKWEHELHEREMHIIQCELKLLMLTNNNNNNQERSHQQTPKVQKRSGRFMRSLLHATLNGNASLSSTTAANLISSPTNFRHLISVCRENNTLQHHYHPSLDYAPTFLPSSSSPPIPCPSSKTLPTIRSHSPDNLYTSKSTPTTPNLNRLRTLTSSEDHILNKVDDEEPLIFNDVHFPIFTDGSSANSSATLPERSSRSSSISQAKTSTGTMQRSRWRKPKPWAPSSSIKRKHPKPNVRHGEAKWYLETISSINTTNTTTANNNTDNTTVTSTTSTPAIDQSTRKLESSDEISSSSSSTCSTPNDRSLARGIFDINTVLVSIGLGRRIPAQLNSSQPDSSTPSSASSSSTTISKTPLHPTILRSTSEMKTKQKSSPSSSTNTSPSPLTKKQHKRTCSSPIANTVTRMDGSPKTGYRARPCYSPVRPNSLILNPIPPPPPPSSPPRMTSNSHSDPQLVNRHFGRGKQSTKITSTPEEEDEQMTDDDYDKFYSAQSSKLTTPMVQTLSSSSNMSSSEPQLNFSYILDIDTEEQITHQTKVLPPETDRKKRYVSQDALERDFLH